MSTSPRRAQKIPDGIAYRSECYKVRVVPRGITKRRPVTITALLDAALELFAEQGYGATSIPEICTRAGLTKGAFYSNFANKDALFLALLDRSWERRAAWIRRALPAGDVLAATDSRDPDSFSHLEVDRQWTLVSMEFSLHAIRRREVARLLVEHELRVRSELAVVVTEALERAERLPTLPVDELARMIVAVTEGSDIQALTNGAGGAVVDSALGTRAVVALLRHFSVSAASVLPRPGDHSQ
jgi:AcrR family transcriptional regulator